MKDTKSKISCYCGKSAAQPVKLVCCVKCKRWLHAGCVKSLGEKILYGDKFYILVCSVCNPGSECLARLEFTWSELIHLVLYHLTIQKQQKYFHIDHEILPFFVENWDKLNLFGTVLTTKKEDKRATIVQVLSNDSSKFKNGKEIKKSKFIWALRVKVPPEPPPVYPSSVILHNDTLVWEFQVMDKKYHILNKNVQKNGRNNLRTGKNKSKIALNGSNKKNIVSKCRGGLPYNENGIHKAKSKTKHPTTVVFNEESAQKGLLDSLIPPPSDFQSFNNPFCKLKKKNSDKKLTSQSETKVQNKRRWNGDMVRSETAQQNSDSQSAKVPPSNCHKKGISIFKAKDIFSHNSEKNVKISFSVLGKRITSYGEIQYLFQKNREIKEPVAGKKLTKIKILCKCPNCKTLK